MSIQVSSPVKENDYTLTTLGSGQTTRDMIRWAYDPATEVNDVSPEVYIFQEPTLYYNKGYVVASLGSIIPEGPASLATVKPTIEGLVKNRKKAAVLVKELGNPTDLAQVATKYNTSIDTAKGVNFLTDFIANLGEEPSVAAYARTAPLNNISSPIEGARGVYLITPINRTEPNAPNIATLRSSYTNQMATQTKAGLIQSLRKNADIKDRRYTFF